MLGVVRLTGDVVAHDGTVRLRCALPVKRGPTAVLGPDGRPAPVALAAGATAEGPGNGPASAVSRGDAIWGFAWLGSYCGSDVSAIAMPLSLADGPRTLHVPLSGPQPYCSTGINSSLVDGIEGAPGQPVQPPRPDYATLRLTGHIRAGTTRYILAPTDLTLTNTGTAAIALDPCPAYEGLVSATARSGGFAGPIGPHYLPCTERSPVIRPGESLHVTVPATTFDERTIPGSAVGLELGIAGVTELHLIATAH